MVSGFGFTCGGMVVVTLPLVTVAVLVEFEDETPDSGLLPSVFDLPVGTELPA